MPRWVCKLRLPVIGGHIWDDGDGTGPVCVRCKARLW